MWDLGLGKLLIIATVAFVVIGPTRLPTVARAAGLLYARLEKYITGFKSELRQELAQAEFNKLETAYRDTQQEFTKAFTLNSPSSSQASTLSAVIKPSAARKTSQASVRKLPNEQLSLFGEAPTSILRSEHRDRR